MDLNLCFSPKTERAVRHSSAGDTRLWSNDFKWIYIEDNQHIERVYATKNNGRHPGSLLQSPIFVILLCLVRVAPLFTLLIYFIVSSRISVGSHFSIKRQTNSLERNARISRHMVSSERRNISSRQTKLFLEQAKNAKREAAANKIIFISLLLLSNLGIEPQDTI